MQTLDDAEGGGERVVVKSPGGAIRVEVSSSTGDVSVFYDGSPEPLVGVLQAVVMNWVSFGGMVTIG